MPTPTRSNPSAAVPGSGDGLRARKLRRTHDELERAALELFDRHGFEATTVDEIAERAGVSRRTFFRHFPSKESVLFAREEETVAALGDALAHRPDDEPPLVSVLASLLEFADTAGDDLDLQLLRVRIARNVPEVLGRMLAGQRRWENVMADWLEDNRRLPRLEALTVAALATGVIKVALTRWIENGGQDDPRELFADSIELMIRAMGGLEAAPR